MQTARPDTADIAFKTCYICCVTTTLNLQSRLEQIYKSHMDLRVSWSKLVLEYRERALFDMKIQETEAKSNRWSQLPKPKTKSAFSWRQQFTA
jgi:hypothetical protein